MTPSRAGNAGEGDAGSSPRSALLSSFRATFIAGRWLLMVSATLQSAALLLSANPLRPSLLVAALVLLFLYNTGTLVLVHRVPVSRLPAAAMMGLDLLFIAAVARCAGGADSPFLNQGYLVILAGALLYGLRGGVLVALGASIVSLIVASGVAGSVMRLLRDLIPYFLIAGGFTGFLVGRLRASFEQYQESLAREEAQRLSWDRERHERELARGIQQAALPLQPPRIPGLEIAVRSLAAQEVGGDFHLFVFDPEENAARIGLVVGDVSGKGIPAALVSTSVAHLFPWLDPLRDPGAAFRNLNRDLNERLPDSSYVTLLMADVDACGGTVDLWCAGHPPALCWRANRKCVEEAIRHDLYLGTFPAWDGAPERWPLEIGDVLLLYSDGLNETRNAQGKQFGIDGAARVLGENADRLAEEIADALLAAARAWGEFRDDLTILVCRRIPDTDGGSACREPAV